MLQTRIKNQIKMFRTFEEDLLNRMALFIGSIRTKISNNKTMKKQHQGLYRDLLSILDEKSHMKAATESLLQMYKFQHTVQIIRFLNMRRA